MVESVIAYLVSSGIWLALIFSFGYILRGTISAYINEWLKRQSSFAIQEQQRRFDEGLARVHAELQRAGVGQDRTLTSILDVASERAKLISRKQFEAAETLWAAVASLDKLRMAATAADRLNFDKIEEAASSEIGGIQKVAEVLTQNIDEKISTTDCHLARLFVTEKAWALFSAYQGIMASNTMKLTGLAMGLHVAKLIDAEALHKAILDALPHQKPTLEKFPSMQSTLFLDELRGALIRELRESFRGHESTREEIESAKQILTALSHN